MLRANQLRHQNDIAGPIEAPALVGQHAKYMQRQRALYRTQERSNDVYERMPMIAQRLTPQEIERLSVSGIAVTTVGINCWLRQRCR
jgi:cytochrome c553